MVTRASTRRNTLAASIILALVVPFALLPAAQAMYPRPRSAPAVKVSLVPAFNVCSSPNRQHGPPLDDGSCSPPAQSSTAVTIGTPENNTAGDNSVGNVKVSVSEGIPGPPDDSDVLFSGSVSDVRCLAATTACGNANAVDGADYTGSLTGSADIRITDRWNGATGGGGTEAATGVVIPFPFRFTCTSTADVDIGGLCTVNTSANAIISGGPPPVKDGQRSVWELGQVSVFDGGPDGDTSTSPNTRFLRQGVFVP